MNAFLKWTVLFSKGIIGGKYELEKNSILSD